MANTITASFGLNLNPLKAAAKSAKSIGAGLGSSFTSLIGPLAAIGAAVGAAFGAKKFADGVKGALDLGGALSDVAAQTGIAAGKAYELQEQLQDNGVSAEEFSGIINKMQKTLAAPAGKQAIQDLGLSFAEISKMTPDAQFVAIGKAIGKISDPTKKTAAAMSVFGKSGAGLLASFADSAFGNADATLSKQAEILNRDAETFDAASDRLGKITRPLKGFFLGVASSIATSLIPILDKIIAVDLVGIGKIFGAAMIVAFDAFKGAFADPETAMNVLTDGLIAGFLTAGNYLISIFEFLGKLVSNKDFMSGILNVFLGIEGILSGALMKGFASPLAFFRDTMEFIVSKAVAAFNRINPASDFNQQVRKAEKEMQDASDALSLALTGSPTVNDEFTSYEGVAPMDRNSKEFKKLNLDLTAKIKAREALMQGTTFAEIQAANKGQDLTIGGKNADELIAEGRATAGKGGTDIITATIAAFKDTKTTDALGAGQYSDKLQAGLAKLRAQGAQMMGPAAPVAAAAAKAVDKSPFDFGFNPLSGDMMDAGTMRISNFVGKQADILPNQKGRTMDRFLFGAGLDYGKDRRKLNVPRGLTTNGLTNQSGTGLKPLVTETPATAADKAAIDNEKNSGNLLTAFKELLAAWTH